MKALEKDRTRRYETANGLAMDIQRHLDNEPVLARPPSGALSLPKTGSPEQASGFGLGNCGCCLDRRIERLDVVIAPRTNAAARRS